MGKPMLGIGQFGGGGGGGGITNGAGANVIAMSDGTNLVASPLSVSGNNVTGTGTITATGFTITGAPLTGLTLFTGYFIGIGAGSLYFRTGGKYQFSNSGGSVVGELSATGTLSLLETTAAEADQAGLGQIWVKNTVPNELWFTRDDGTDVLIA